MSRSYFNRFPDLLVSRYKTGSTTETQSQLVKDIMIRYKIRESVLSNASLFYPYRWQDGDRPDTVAERYYGSASFFWVVFYSNGAFDLNYDFPMSQRAFNNYLIEKYRPSLAAQQNLTLSQFDALDAQVRYELAFEFTRSNIAYYTIGGVVVDASEYADSLDPDAQAVSLYDAELNRNEERREVQLLDNAYLTNVVREFNRETADVIAVRDQAARLVGEVV